MRAMRLLLMLIACAAWTGAVVVPRLCLARTQRVLPHMRAGPYCAPAACGYCCVKGL